MACDQHFVGGDTLDKLSLVRENTRLLAENLTLTQQRDEATRLLAQASTATQAAFDAENAVLSDDDIERCILEGWRAHRVYVAKPRGQMLMPADDANWHVCRATEALVMARMQHRLDEANAREAYESGRCGEKILEIADLNDQLAVVANQRDRLLAALDALCNSASLSQALWDDARDVLAQIKRRPA